ncbi:scavenger receptor cysteine-rich type 1 protein M130-like [Arapaima gigas]
MRTILLLLNTWAICGMEKLRLWGGQGPCDGRVEVFYNGEWGVICNHKWSIANEKVICRALGCGNPNVSPNEYSSTDPPKKVWMNEISCTGEEKNLWDCPFNGWGVSPCNYDTQHIIINCSGSEEANVVCRQLNCGTSRVIPPKGLFTADGPTMISLLGCLGQEKHLWQCPKRTMVPCEVPHTPAAVICSNTVKVVLLDGAKESRCFGTVHLNRNGKNEAVCYGDWIKLGASVICKELGCGSPVLVKPGEWTQDGHVNDFFCYGSESSIFHCMANYGQARGCNKAKIMCDSHVKVRLADGTGRCAGRVEILYWDKWMSVSSEQWEKKETNVACSISVNLSEECWGKVRVTTGGLHGAVCDDVWTQDHSRKLCQHLGCGTAVPMLKVKRIPGGVNIGSVYCAHKDSPLTQCKFIPNSRSSYCQDRPVYVTCSASIKSRIVDPKEKCSGNLELFHSSRWYPVCTKTLNGDLLNLVCRELGCGTALTGHSVALYTERSTQGLPSVKDCKGNFSSPTCNIEARLETCQQGHVHCWARMMLKDFNTCEGRVYVLTQAGLHSVSSQGWGDKEVQVLCKYLRCGNRTHHESTESSLKLWWKHTYDCSGKEKSIWQCETKEEPTVFQQLYISCTGNPIMKLNGTPGQCFGRVQVAASGLMRGVCAEQWDMKQSQVVCQEMSCSGAIGHDSEKDQALAYYFNCTGKESRLWQCSSEVSECNSALSLVCADSIKLRLSETCGGKIEILYGGIWKPVCPVTNRMAQEKICSELNCGKVISPKRKANQETRELDISLECNDSETFIKHCVHRKTCELKIPGEVYCERYVPGKENVVPVGTVVGVSLGLLLVVVAAVLIFWQRRHKRASRSRQVVRNTSVFESGDYEDIEPNMQEMLAPEVNISDHMSAFLTTLLISITENDVGADRQDSEASSQSAYDDVEQESSDPTEPMLKEGHKFSSQKLTTENEVCGKNTVLPKLPEDYDDALASSSLKEPPGSQEHTGIGNCESGSTEEYIQPIE